MKSVAFQKLVARASELVGSLVKDQDKLNDLKFLNTPLNIKKSEVEGFDA